MDATTVDVIGERAAHTQNLFVMRHGERLDAADPTWIPTAARPWDPPLTETGKLQALAVGQKFRSEGMVITRVLVSPFLRCVQTAAEVIKGMSSVDSGGVVTSRVKVSNLKRSSSNVLGCGIQIVELCSLYYGGSIGVKVKEKEEKESLKC